jgi:hypothetical protein
MKEPGNGFQPCCGCLFGLFSTHIFSFLVFYVFVVSTSELLNEYRMDFGIFPRAQDCVVGS